MSSSISLLIPTRGRPRVLENSIRSALDLANDPSRIEVLAWLDDDDPYLESSLRVLEACGAISVTTIVKSRAGYPRMHECFNELAAASSGSWIVNWNDDMEWLTRGWDSLLLQETDLLIAQMPRRDTCQTSDHTVPVTGRDVYDVLGHLSGASLCDAWMSEVTVAAGIAKSRDDISFHHACLPAVDREPADEIVIFRAQEMELLRQIDVAKLIAARSTR